MARLIFTIAADNDTIELDIILIDTQDVFYLTGQAEQPVCYDANALPCLYGYIRRHHNEYILYSGQTICVNDRQMTMAIHLLQDGDKLTFSPVCQMTFRTNS